MSLIFGWIDLKFVDIFKFKLIHWQAEPYQSKLKLAVFLTSVKLRLRLIWILINKQLIICQYSIK